MLRVALKFSCLVLVFQLAGCATALVGGVAQGGNQSSQGDRSADDYARDTGITSEINKRFVKDELISAFDVNISTYRGNVTLYGSVRSAQAARRAVDLARSVRGVRQVVSKLTVVDR